MNYRRILIAVLLLSLLFIILKYVFPFFAPFIIGLIVAGLIDPGIQWIESRWGWSRHCATITVIFILITVIVFSLLIIVGGVCREVEGLIKDVPKVTKWSSFFVERLNSIFTDFQKTLPQEIIQGVLDYTRNISGVITRFSFGVINSVKALPNLIGNLMITVMSCYFFVRDKEYWLDLLNRSLPISWAPEFKQLGAGLYDGMLRLIRLESTMMIFTFFLTGFILAVLGYPRAWMIALIVGIMEPLPMIGPGAVLFPWAGYLMVTGEWRIAILLIGLACLLMVARQWLELRLLGGELGFHPLFTLIGLYLGLKLFGFVGLIIAPLGLSVMRPLTVLLNKRWNFRLEHPF